jgi:Protein of unknown function (DUF1569)
VKTLANTSFKEEVLRRLAALGEDSARRWGKMSCHQMIVHLSDSFLCPMGERKVSRAKVPVPRGVYRWVALYLPMRWPHGISTRPEMEQGIGGTALVEFSGDREKLVALIERFVKKDFEWEEHPIFGEMSEKDWLRWGYLHCDHHLRQFGV